MIKFKLGSSGIDANRRKDFLPTICKNLKMPFTLDDIEDGMFSDHINKKLQKTTKHGTQIVLRSGRCYKLWIEVINKDDQLKQKNTLTSLKRQYTLMIKSEVVQEFIKLRSKLYRLTNYSEEYKKL